jgi:hypothetical protein
VLASCKSCLSLSRSPVTWSKFDLKWNGKDGRIGEEEVKDKIGLRKKHQIRFFMIKVVCPMKYAWEIILHYWS